MIDFKQGTQRQHLAFAQQKNVVTDSRSERDLLIVGDAERAVVLRQSFIEPERDVFESVFDEQMCVFVEDDGERVLAAAYLGGERDVVDVGSRLEISGDVWIRLERRVRVVALENDNSSGHGRVESYLRKEERKHFTKLLEFQADFPDVFLTSVADQ